MRQFEECRGTAGAASESVVNREVQSLSAALNMLQFRPRNLSTENYKVHFLISLSPELNLHTQPHNMFSGILFVIYFCFFFFFRGRVSLWIAWLSENSVDQAGL